MYWLKRLADNRQEQSLATRLRLKRFAFFRDLLSSLPPPIRILDVGGTENFWLRMGVDQLDGVEITLLNRTSSITTHPALKSVVGDARDMSDIEDKQFDVVFSNSVIEHVGNFENQRRMAQEVQRVGKRYFVQTPNRYFPIEPHFLVPFFQFFPISVRVFLVRHFNLGWYPKTPERQKALALVEEIKLLNERELREIFPGASVYREKILGLTKSLIVYNGWTEVNQ